MFLVPPKSHATDDHCPGNDADVRSDVGFLKRSTTGSGTKGILSQKTKPKMKTRAPKDARRPRLDPTVLRRALRGLASVVAHVGNSEINLSQIWQFWPGVWTLAPHQGQVTDTGERGVFINHITNEEGVAYILILFKSLPNLYFAYDA